MSPLVGLAIAWRNVSDKKSPATGAPQRGSWEEARRFWNTFVILRQYDLSPLR
jgi:hypothetical protein